MKVLAVIDMQNDFISGALGTPEAKAMIGDNDPLAFAWAILNQ